MSCSSVRSIQCELPQELISQVKTVGDILLPSKPYFCVYVSCELRGEVNGLDLVGALCLTATVAGAGK